MLLEFKVGNFLSFDEIVTFSMVGTTPIKEHEEDNSFSNVFSDPSGKLKLLKSSVLYGANGSGKSNLISAMAFFRDFILTSSNEKQANDEIKVLKFLLNAGQDNEPSFFEMIFFIENTRYRYGFEVDKEKVHAEWLFMLAKEAAKESKLFTREFQEISLNKQIFKEGKGIENKTRANALFLSTVAQLNGEKATQIRTWFKTDLIIMSGLDDDSYSSYTIEKFKNEPKFKQQLIDFFKTIRIGFEDIEVVEEDKLLENLITHTTFPKEMPAEMQEILKDLKTLQERMKNLQNSKVESKAVSINFFHKKFDETSKAIELVVIDYGLQSKGTQKLFNIFGLWIDALENGKIIVVDELDSRLHTLLTIELIKFFHLSENKSAQLIFASHDTNLLKKEYFRRDQIWFCEKNKIGATDLYSLVEYYKTNKTNVIRNDASFEKDYLLGKYGAIPFLGDIYKFTNDFSRLVEV